MYVHGQLLEMGRRQLPGAFSGLHLNTADKKLLHRSFGHCSTPPLDPQQTDELDNFAKGEVIWLSMLVGSLCSVRALKSLNWWKRWR